MALEDADTDLLETYLDGELPVSEAEGLWRRLAAEPALVAALDELRSLRTSRLAVWEQLEPDDQTASVLCGRIGSSVRRHRMWERARRSVAYVSAAAACLVIGYNLGWTQRGSGMGNMASPTATVANNYQPASFPVAVHDPSGKVIAVQQFDSPKDASDFMNDLNNSQLGSQPRDLGPHVVPASDEQF